jgi:hypothetical protein
MEEQQKIKRNIYRFFHPESGSKLNIWAATDEEAMTTFSTIVKSVIPWKLRKPAPSSKRFKQRPHTNLKKNGSPVH